MLVPLSVGRVCSKFQVQRCKDQRYNDTSADIHFDSMGDLELRAEHYTQRRITARLQTSINPITILWLLFQPIPISTLLGYPFNSIGLQPTTSRQSGLSYNPTLWAHGKEAYKAEKRTRRMRRSSMGCKPLFPATPVRFRCRGREVGFMDTRSV